MTAKRLPSSWIFGLASLSVIGTEGAARAGSHLWKINEVFSNADGTIQFLELKECCGATLEIFLNGLQVTSLATGKVFQFGANLPMVSTANRHLLLGTVAFAAMPGAPTPDYIIPANFIGTGSDTLRYAPVQNYDTFTFGAGAMPTNGTMSIHMTDYNSHTFTTAANSPTNFAGESGSITAVCTDGDSDGYGSPGNPVCPNGSATDCNDANPAIHPGAAEVCDDTLDNDCDTKVDCQDPSCSAFIACVPTLSDVGLVAMVGALLATGGLVIRRRA